MQYVNDAFALTLTFEVEQQDTNFQWRSGQERHSETVTGEVAGPSLTRITPSEVEQKFFVPAESLTGVATATYSLQGACWQGVVRRNS